MSQAAKVDRTTAIIGLSCSIIELINKKGGAVARNSAAALFNYKSQFPGLNGSITTALLSDATAQVINAENINL